MGTSITSTHEHGFHSHSHHSHHSHQLINHNNAILTAAQPFFVSSTINLQDMVPDRPIGYGAFGVVW